MFCRSLFVLLSFIIFWSLSDLLRFTAAATDRQCTQCPKDTKRNDLQNTTQKKLRLNNTDLIKKG